MKKAVSYLEQYLEKNDSYTRGKIVIATVYGDVHDIGKNLVKTIVSNNGYEVIDLGKQVPAKTIIEKAKELKADAIGLSALLVSTSKQMKIIVEELDKENLELPVIIGGASINTRFSKDISLVEGHKYKGGVFYAKSAFDGLEYVKKLTSDEKRKLLLEYFEREIKTTGEVKIEKVDGKSDIVPSQIIPTVPFYGSKIIENINLNEVYKHLNLDYIYKLHWGIRLPKEEYEKAIKDKFGKILDDLKIEAIEKKYLVSKAVYGYFRCKKEGNDLIILDDSKKEITRFSFPRQNGLKFLCLSDYFNSVKEDVVALSVCTVGDNVSKVCQEFNDKGEYDNALYLHGLAVETAEAIAEYINRIIIKEMGFPAFQGLRYSFGYPACPNLSEQVKLFKLLDAEKTIGTKLTESFQIDPECSTSAIVVYHKDCSYFNV